MAHQRNRGPVPAMGRIASRQSWHQLVEWHIGHLSTALGLFDPAAGVPFFSTVALVDAGPPVEFVPTVRAKEPVGSVVSVDVIASRATDQDVIAVPSDDLVVALAPEDIVGSISSIETGDRHGLRSPTKWGYITREGIAG